MALFHGDEIFWKVPIKVIYKLSYKNKTAVTITNILLLQNCMVTYILYLYIYQLTHLQRIFGFIGGRLRINRILE